jgi:hypothetical protein
MYSSSEAASKRRHFLEASTAVLLCALIGVTRASPTRVVSSRRWPADSTVGVTGNGSTDDRARLQELLNRASEAGGGLVYALPGKRYLVAPKLGAQKFVGNQERSFGLEIPANVVLDLRGSTIEATPDTDYVLLSNANSAMGKREDSNLGIVNGTIDFRYASANGRAQAIAFYGVRKLHLDGLEIRRGFNAALDLEDCEEFNIGRLVFRSCIGAAFYAGGAVRSGGGSISNGHIESVIAYGTRDHPRNSGLPGNPVLLNAKNTTIGQLCAFDSDAGIKLTDGHDIHIRRVEFERGTKQNSGLKIQGAKPTQIVHNVTVDEVLSTDCGGPGLFLTWCRDVLVRNYTGRRNALLGRDSDVVIAGERIMISTLESTLSGRYGVEVTNSNERFWSGSPNAQIGSALIDRPWNIANVDNAAALIVVNGTLEVDALHVADHRASPRTKRLATTTLDGRLIARQLRWLER